MSYIGKIDKSVSCIYGSFNIKVDKEVPMLFAVKFPQYCTFIQDPEPEIKIEDIQEEIEIEIKLETKPEFKKGNKQ